MWLSIIALVVAYLLGSVSSAILVCKFAGLPDPRSQGSGNPGASNVLRMAGKTYAALTLLGDGAKGFLAVFIGLILGAHGMWLTLIALAAVVGHCFPIFFKFQGGKGVATSIGAYLLLSFPLGIISIIIWAVLAFIFRYASLASLAACVLAPFICLVFHPPYFIGLALIALLIVWRHWSNIENLRKGTEVKIDLNAVEEKK